MINIETVTEKSTSCSTQHHATHEKQKLAEQQ